MRSESPYRGHRFPREIISHFNWLYFRFGVSFRDVEELMAARGVLLSYETVRRWCDKFGKEYATGLRRCRARTSDKWHLDEVFLKINGANHYLWRAVDQNGVVLDILVQPKRDRFAAIRFFRKLLRVTGIRPRVVITDKLRSYAAAKRIVMPAVAHRQQRYLKQPGGELSSTNARAGTANETIQVRSPCPAFCRGARHHRFALPPATPLARCR